MWSNDGCAPATCYMTTFTTKLQITRDAASCRGSSSSRSLKVYQFFRSCFLFLWKFEFVRKSSLHTCGQGEHHHLRKFKLAAAISTECRFILYHSIALWMLYNFGFKSASIGWLVGPQIYGKRAWVKMYGSPGGRQVCQGQWSAWARHPKTSSHFFLCWLALC